MHNLHCFIVLTSTRLLNLNVCKSSNNLFVDSLYQYFLCGSLHVLASLSSLFWFDNFITRFYFKQQLVLCQLFHSNYSKTEVKLSVFFIAATNFPVFCSLLICQWIDHVLMSMTINFVSQRLKKPENIPILIWDQRIFFLHFFKSFSKMIYFVSIKWLSVYFQNDIYIVNQLQYQHCHKLEYISIYISYVQAISTVWYKKRTLHMLKSTHRWFFLICWTLSYLSVLPLLCKES